jgi:hypothetical protein
MQTNTEEFPTPKAMPTPEFLPTPTPTINTPRRKFLAARKVFEIFEGKKLPSKRNPVSFITIKSLPECEQEQHQQQHTLLNKRTVKCNHSPTHETTPRKKRKLEGGT